MASSKSGLVCRCAVVTAAFVTVVGLAACQSTSGVGTAPPSAPAKASATPAPPKEFKSSQYSYRVTLTTEWSAAFATTGWEPTVVLSLDLPSLDHYQTATGRDLDIAASRVSTGTSLEEWRKSIIDAKPSVCVDPPSFSRTTLGSEPALVWASTCPSDEPPYSLINLAAIHDGRGYLFILLSPIQYDQADSQRIFEAARRSFAFTS
jgi:hypothetical protein